MAKFKTGDFIKFKNQWKKSTCTIGVITDSSDSFMKVQTLGGNITINTYDYSIKFIDLSNMKEYEFEIYCKLVGSPYKIKYRGNIVTKLKETDESLDYLHENGNISEFNKDKPCISIIEHCQSTLDDVEIKYLTNILKPLQLIAPKIVLKHNYTDNTYYLVIYGINSYTYKNHEINLPEFRPDTNMYKGMMLNKIYSSRHLGLEV